MATKSIQKDVIIRDKNLSRTLLEALSKAREIPKKSVDLYYPCKEITEDEIEDFFGEDDE